MQCQYYLKTIYNIMHTERNKTYNRWGNYLINEKKDANNAKIAVNLGLHLKLIQIISPTGCSKEKSQNTT